MAGVNDPFLRRKAPDDQKPQVPGSAAAPPSSVAFSAVIRARLAGPSGTFGPPRNSSPARGSAVGGAQTIRASIASLQAAETTNPPPASAPQPNAPAPGTTDGHHHHHHHHHHHSDDDNPSPQGGTAGPLGGAGAASRGGLVNGQISHGAHGLLDDVPGKRPVGDVGPDRLGALGALGVQGSTSMGPYSLGATPAPPSPNGGEDGEDGEDDEGREHHHHKRHDSDSRGGAAGAGAAGAGTAGPTSTGAGAATGAGAGAGR